MKNFLCLLILLAVCIFTLSACDTIWQQLSDIIDPHVHEFGEWATVKDATCTTEGKQIRICTCGEEQSQSIEMIGHKKVLDAAVAATCTTEGITEGWHCSVCNEILVPQTVVEMIPHTEVASPGFAPTCTGMGLAGGTHCAVCSKTLVAPTALDKLPHTEVFKDGVPATCTTWGATGTVHCSVCQKFLQEQAFLSPEGHTYENGICTACGKKEIDYSDLSLYVSHEGEAFFQTAPNGAAMRALYEEMETTLTEFHTSTRDAWYYIFHNELGNLYAVAEINYRKYGLSFDEIDAVASLFRKDHPALYWMAYVYYWTDETLTITTVEDYANGERRQEYNEILYQGIEEYARLADGETSAYNIALTYYEAILKNTEYAYTADREPEPALWTHSVIGAFVYDKFVCEGYAKLFQLLLNLSGVENMYIVGMAEDEAHSWNLVQLDDGNWYWFDLTWADDDTGNHEYFAWLDENLETHVPAQPIYDWLLNATLPQRATAPFEHEEVLEIGEIITVDDCQYMMCSARTVTLIKGKTNTTADKLLYNGVVYHIER